MSTLSLGSLTSSLVHPNKARFFFVSLTVLSVAYILLRRSDDMGNCFGKTKSSNFAGEGRTLGGSAPVNAPVASSSAKVPAGASGGRTLGGGSGDDDPKSAAARAAEARKQSAQGTGKLGKQLDAQKKMTNADTLAQGP
ncbi:Hypothetical protein D9617_35g089960 [Elsinoe fawcettii]|nr:Hypothetical protein D9617_35g089960 [Elsinoe fawcettii]